MFTLNIMSFVNNLRLRELPKPKEKIRRKIGKILEFDEQINAEREKSKTVIINKENEWKKKEKKYQRELNQKEIG